MKIVFLSFSGLKFDINTPDNEPLGGTESAICYLGRELIKNGHDVLIWTDGVSHKFKPDIQIIANAPYAAPTVKSIYPGSKLILWNHMRPDQNAITPLFDHDIRKSIDEIVYVSESQRQSYTVSRPDLDGLVINNAIAPCFENMFSSAKELLRAKECRGAYTSTPFRGLELLRDLRELPIDVYSSMAVYQQPDQPFANIYEKLSHNGAIKLHSSLSQPELAKRLKHCAFLVYPCTFQECHSIAIIEAQAAGMKVLTTPLAHAPDEFVSVSVIRSHMEWFKKLLTESIISFKNYPQEWAERMYEQVQMINSTYTWSLKAAEWEKLMETLLHKEAA